MSDRFGGSQDKKGFRCESEGIFLCIPLSKWKPVELDEERCDVVRGGGAADDHRRPSF